MWANNETGVLFPVESIAEICRSRGVLYHCDAVQAAGKVEIDVQKIPADYVSLTGHKFNAPKGIGALYVWRRSPFSPLVYGGHWRLFAAYWERSMASSNISHQPFALQKKKRVGRKKVRAEKGRKKVRYLFLTFFSHRETGVAKGTAQRAFYGLPQTAASLAR
jgi:kynureninase